MIDRHHDRYKFPVWNKDTIFDIVGDTYDKIGYVDSDSMIHWDALIHLIYIQMSGVGPKTILI